MALPVAAALDAARRLQLTSSPLCTLADLVSLRAFGSRLYAAEAEEAAQREREHDAGCTCRERARVLDGRAVSAQWQDELAHEVATMRAKGLRRPGLGVVLVGDRPDSHVYVARKQEACSRVRSGRGVLAQSAGWGCVESFEACFCCLHVQRLPARVHLCLHREVVRALQPLHSGGCRWASIQSCATCQQTPRSRRCRTPSPRSAGKPG